MLPHPDDIFQVYRIRHDSNGDVKRQLAGRFLFEDGNVSVLEDYFGLLDKLDGPLDDRKQRLIRSLANSGYTDVVRTGDLKDGSRPDLLPKMDLGDDLDSGGASGTAASVAHTAAMQVAPPPAVFDYHRAGMETPQVLELHRPTGTALLNGQALTEEEVQQILQNLDDGTATIRYRGVHALPGMAKMESTLERFFKAEPEDDVFGVLQHLKGLVAGGHVSPEQLQTLHRATYGDPMVADVGNKRAYRDFLTRPREGTHIMMDMNNLKLINDELGHDAGDKAIKTTGKAMRDAMDETVGREQGKLFRFGGDEFAAHVPTYEHAAQFARALRSKLEAVPALGGTHRLSVSVGLGHTPAHADQALNLHAKAAKAKDTAARGMRSNLDPRMSSAPEAMYAHSLAQGHEGAIPTGAAPVKLSASLQAPEHEAKHVATTPVEPAGPQLGPKTGAATPGGEPA